jgi:hypothetical protein
MARGRKVRVSDEFKEAVRTEIERLRGSGRVREAVDLEEAQRKMGKAQDALIDASNIWQGAVQSLASHYQTGTNDAYAKRLTRALIRQAGGVGKEITAIHRSINEVRKELGIIPDR